MGGRVRDILGVGDGRLVGRHRWQWRKGREIRERSRWRRRTGLANVSPRTKNRTERRKTISMRIKGRRGAWHRPKDKGSQKWKKGRQTYRSASPRLPLLFLPFNVASADAGGSAIDIAATSLLTVPLLDLVPEGLIIAIAVLCNAAPALFRGDLMLPMVVV